jgi:hypothetical protein
MENSHVPSDARRSSRAPLDFAELARVDEERLQVLTQLHIPASDAEPEPERQIERDHARDPCCVVNATGFTITEFWELFDVVKETLQAKFSARGKAPHFNAVDTFYILLQHLRTDAKPAQLAVTHGVSPSIMQSTLERGLAGTRDALVAKYITPISKGEQVKRRIACAHFPEVCLIVDCSVQECERPAGHFGGEQKRFFSGKHHYHCYKREYAHLPNGSVAFISDVFPGSVHDMTVCRTMHEKYSQFVAKKPDELKLEDPDVGATSWAILADKGYIGLDQALRAIVPNRANSRTAAPTPSSATSRVRGAPDSTTILQARHGSARVACENFYGRKVRCFQISRNCFTATMDKFRVVDDITTALTNYHLLKRPLRREDAHLHRVLLEERKEKAITRIERKRAQNAEYQRTFRRRVEQTEQ